MLKWYGNVTRYVYGDVTLYTPASEISIGNYYNIDANEFVIKHTMHDATTKLMALYTHI